MKNTPKTEQTFNRAVGLTAAALKVPVTKVSEALNKVPGLQKEIIKRTWDAVLGSEGEARIVTATSRIKGKAWNIKVITGKDEMVTAQAENFREKFAETSAISRIVSDGSVQCHHGNLDECDTF